MAKGSWNYFSLVYPRNTSVKVRLQLTLKDSREKTISTAAPPLVTGRKWTPSKAVRKLHQPWSWKTLWGRSSREEEVLAWKQANKPGEELQHQTREHWWLRRCVDRRRLCEERRLSLLLSRSNECCGKVWRGERSAGGSCGKWKQTRLALSSE